MIVLRRETKLTRIATIQHSYSLRVGASVGTWGLYKIAIIMIPTFVSYKSEFSLFNDRSWKRNKVTSFV